MGEPILNRSVRLLQEYAPKAEVRVVVPDFKDKRYMVPPSSRTIAKLNPENGDADKFLSSAHLWHPSERTLILYGDLFVTREAVQQMVDPDLVSQDGWWFFARFDGSKITGHQGGECFAYVVDPEGHETFAAACNRVAELWRAGTIKRCGGWETYRALMGLPDDQILRYFSDGLSTHNPRLGHCTEIDDWTEDMDGPSDWDNWCYRFAKADPADRPAR